MTKPNSCWFSLSGHELDYFILYSIFFGEASKFYVIYIVPRFVKLDIQTLFGMQFFTVKACMTCRSVSNGGYTIGFILV